MLSDVSPESTVHPSYRKVLLPPTNLCLPRPSLSGCSAPETALELEGARDEDVSSRGGDGGGGAGTIAVPESGGNPVGEPSEGGLSPVPSAKDFCFVKAILHLPDEESRPSVSMSRLALQHALLRGSSFFMRNRNFRSTATTSYVLDLCAHGGAVV